VDSSDPKAFRRAELPLLCAYVQALSLSRWYASVVNEGGDTKEAFSRWEALDPGIYPHEDEAPEGSGRGFKNTSGVRLGMGAVRCPDACITNLPLLRLFQTPSATHCSRAPTEANADPYFLRVVSQAE
jgi:hypothetical protein